MLVLKEFLYLLVIYAIKAYILGLFIYCIAGFFIRDRYAGWYVFLQELMEPPLQKIRNLTQNRLNVGTFDLSPILLYFALVLVQRVLNHLFH